MPFLRTIQRLLIALAVLITAGTVVPRSWAGVVVLSNRTASKVEYAVAGADETRDRRSLAPYESDLLPTADSVNVEILDDGETRPYRLRANSIHYIIRPADKLVITPVTLPGVPTEAVRPAGFPGGTLPPIKKISVMLLVDEEEPAIQRVWEKRLRDRLEAASAIFEKACRVRFETGAVGTWTSNNAIKEFDQSLDEFVAKVNPNPCRLAIGFTSQYQIPKGQTHLGGTRGPFASHILIREWSQHVTPRERLEILVHELGHYLGAVHCTEPTSVMRPVLGDRRANARDFQIIFDPGNMFAMGLIAEELSPGGFCHLNALRPTTKTYVRGIYQALGQTMPQDNAAAQYLALLDLDPVLVPFVRYAPATVEATRTVVRAVTEIAEHNAGLPLHGASPDAQTRQEGDRLFELYVRTAAKAAAKYPPEVRGQAFLLGLGMAVDPSDLLRIMPVLRGLSLQVDSEQQRKRRLASLGSPTIQHRRDLTQHFVVSCALAVALGPRAAENLGITKEIQDSISGSGLSFRDLAADFAGTSFAAGILQAKLVLPVVAAGFAVGDFMPESNDLPEKLTWHDVIAKYGYIKDARFDRELAAIRQRIKDLPGYRSQPTVPLPDYRPVGPRPAL